MISSIFTHTNIQKFDATVAKLPGWRLVGARAGNQKARGAELRIVSCFVVKIESSKDSFASAWLRFQKTILKDLAGLLRPKVNCCECLCPDLNQPWHSLAMYTHSQIGRLASHWHPFYSIQGFNSSHRCITPSPKQVSAYKLPWLDRFLQYRPQTNRRTSFDSLLASQCAKLTDLETEGADVRILTHSDHVRLSAVRLKMLIHTLICETNAVLMHFLTMAGHEKKMW